MKKVTKHLTLFIMLLLVSLCIPAMEVAATESGVADAASETVRTGTLGANAGVQWSYDESTKTLTLTGEDSGLETALYTSGNIYRICSDVEKIILQDFKPVGSVRNLFKNLSALQTIEMNNVNTADVTDMSYMFYDCENLTALDVSGFDTAKVTDMRSMFDGCEKLTSLDVSGFDTSNVTNMYYMFFYCRNLTALDVSGFDTSNVTNMQLMFYHCDNLTALDVSGFDTSNVKHIRGMFMECSGLTDLDVSGFDTSNVTDIDYMFYGCSGLPSMNVSDFDTSNVTKMRAMFSGCSSLTSLDVSSFDTSNVTSMYAMFYGCTSLPSLDVSSFDTSNTTDVGSMFSGCKGLIALRTPKTVGATQEIRLPHAFKDSSGNEVTKITQSLVNTMLVSEVPTGDSFVIVADTTLLTVGETQQLQLKIQDVMQNVSANNNYNWSVTSDDVATVSPTGQVTAVGLGTTTIVVTAKEGKKDRVNGGIIDIQVVSAGSIVKQPTDQTVLEGERVSFAVEAAGTGLSYQWQFKTAGAEEWNDLTVAGAKTNCITVQGGVAESGREYRCIVTNANGEKNISDEVTLTVTPIIRTGTLGDNNGISWEYNEKTKTLTVSGTDSGLYANSNSGLFYSICSDVEYMVFDNFKPKGSVRFLCASLERLKEVDLTGFDTSEVTDMGSMFWCCNYLSELDVSGFDTSKVTNMGGMFASCSNLRELDVTGFDTSKVTDMGSMFAACNSLSKVDVSGFDTSNVTDMGGMFANCSSLGKVDVSGFDTSKVTSMDNMFYRCSNLSKLDVSGFDTSNVVYMLGMFEDCSKLTGLDLRTWDTSNVMLMVYMFKGCSSLTELNVSNFDTSEVTAMVEMFYGCSSLNGLDLSNFDTTKASGSVYSLVLECNNLKYLCTPNEMYETATIGLPAIFLDAQGNKISEVTYAQKNTKLTRKTISLVETGMLEVGRSVQMRLKLDDELQDVSVNGNYQWAVSDESVIRVSATGMLEAVGAGTATITVVGEDSSMIPGSITIRVSLIPITVQPSDRLVAEGNSAVFKVAANGSGLRYQWQFRTSDTGAWKNSGMTGSKTDSITVKGTKDRSGYQYRCVITDGSGNEVISDAATLTIAEKLEIMGHPVSQTVTEGNDAVFKVTANGSELSYQWQIKPAESTKWANSGMTGAETNSITVKGTTARNGYQYRCVITDGTGAKIISNAATLTVQEKLEISAQPVSQSVIAGDNATFKVTAKGKDLTYQWQFRTSDTASWKNSGMTGADTNSITVQGTMARNGYQYRCEITDGYGNKVTSNEAVLTVVAKPAITGQPASKSVSVGESVTFAVTATGSNLTYQWQFRTSDTGAWKNSGMTGSKTDSITVKGTQDRDGYQYRCVVTDGSGNKVTSKGATLTVKAPAVTITGQPESKSVTEGASVTFAVTASGTDLTYQWQFRTSDTASWKNSGMTGSKTNSITVQGTKARDGYQYRCVVSDANGNKVTSKAATLTVDEKFAITGQPESKTVATGENATFKVTATGSELTYQWQFRTSDTASWKNSGMTGATTDSITVQGTKARNGYQYRCVITDEGGSKVTSNEAELTVK